MTVIERCEDFTVYRIKDVTGEGIMTCHKVFPGIDLIYNDFHMLNCFSEFIPKVEMIGIDHCREGRIEWEFEDNSYMYLGEEISRSIPRITTLWDLDFLLAAIENADQIIVVDKGSIARRGTHKELMKQEGVYKRFLSIRQIADGWNI